jgi:hypothetical protein
MVILPGSYKVIYIFARNSEVVLNKHTRTTAKRCIHARYDMPSPYLSSSHYNVSDLSPYLSLFFKFQSHRDSNDDLVGLLRFRKLLSFAFRWHRLDRPIVL